MGLKILEAEMRVVSLRTRMPFRYGIATMTEVPLAFVAVTLDMDGKTERGVSSDLLPPKWFTKIADQPVADEVREMEAVIGQAMKLAIQREAASPFELWESLYQDQLRTGDARHWPPLLANFGTSLVERAMLEAFCRGQQTTFAEALRSNLFQIDLGRLHGELKGRTPAEFLPNKPLSTVIVRHTVGLGDPLEATEIPSRERLADGLPQSVRESVQAYGLRHFKIKVAGRVERDLPRLASIYRLLREVAPADYAFSLDGNEQFENWAAFRSFWDSAIGESDLDGFWDHLMFVEQPLHRDVALAEEGAKAVLEWSGRPRMIIDESDGRLEDLERALRLGYAGTSHKNCKGVFKGVGHRCLLEMRRRRDPESFLVMSGEDLCTVGPVSLMQDLAVMAALGIESVERNGHHYHAGLSQLPREWQEQVLAHHADLYRPSASGWPTLRIDQGRVRIDSLNRAPFGTGFALDLKGATPGSACPCDKYAR